MGLRWIGKKRIDEGHVRSSHVMYQESPLTLPVGGRILEEEVLVLYLNILRIVVSRATPNAKYSEVLPGQCARPSWHRASKQPGSMVHLAGFYSI
jgi:hypothetical protein